MEIGLVGGILEGCHMFTSKTKFLQQNDDIVITKGINE
jgi:hypothetical protein